MPVTVTGASHVQAVLARVADTATAPASAHAAAAQLIAAAARPPRRTGRLAASIRPFPGPGARVGSDVPYAPLVENRTHFLHRAVTTTQEQWLALYRQAIADACEG